MQRIDPIQQHEWSHAGILVLSLVLATAAGGATIYVDVNANPGGNGTSWETAFNTIAAGISMASGGDTVLVADGTYTGDGNRDLSFAGKAITVKSTNGAESCIIDCQGTEQDPHRAFSFTNNETAESVLDGFAITGGFKKPGGGIFCESSNPSILNCMFTGNAADIGGGVFNYRSSPRFANCTFSGNTANDNNGGGMGNHFSGPVLTDCTFTGNTADFGGGLVNYDSSPSLTNCTFSGNTAYEGGGLSNIGKDSIPILTNCTFTRNTAEYGGGLFNEKSSPELANCGFSENTAGVGGGLYNLLSSPVLTNCTFTGNMAAAGGGLLNHESSPTLSDCTFSGNTANDGNGGGMTNYSSSPDLDNCTFTGNTADIGGGLTNNESSPTLVGCSFNKNTANDYGGGLYNLKSSPTLTDCSFSDNTARVGGGVYNERKQSLPIFTNCTFTGNAAEAGGGLVNDESSPTLADCNFSDNTSDDSGGGLSNWLSSPKLTNCTFSANSAKRGGGLQNYESSPTLTDCNFTENTADDSGGGLYNEVSFPMLNNCTFTGNTADYGSGLSNYKSNPALVDCTFIGNTADHGGGGLANVLSSPVLTDCTFTGNTADFGGGISNDKSSNPTLATCTFTGNTGDTHGGGLSNEVSSPRLTNCTFTGNTADGDGGGLFNDESSPTLTDCNFSENIAGYRGGGLRNLESSPVLTNCTFTGNTADFGGGMHGDRSSPTLADCSFSGNTAHDYGGGLFNDRSFPLLTNCTFTRNTGRAGGGVYSYKSNPTLANCSFSTNAANEDGGAGLYSTDSSPSLTSCTFSGNALRAIDSNLVGPGSISIGSDVTMQMVDSYIGCDITGEGLIRVPLGRELIIGGQSQIELSGPGHIICDGLLRVKDSAAIRSTTVHVTRASFEGDVDISNSVIHADAGAPYGQFFVQDTVTIVGNEIHADGDRYLDLTSSDNKVIENNRIYVTITEGKRDTRGGLLELRGADMACSGTFPGELGVYPCQEVPPFDTVSWTLEELRIEDDAKVNLTNRFDFGNGGQDEVMYVKHLIIGENSKLNTAYNRLYFENLYCGDVNNPVTLADVNDNLVNIPLLGFSLNMIRFNQKNDFLTRVQHNNYLYPDRDPQTEYHPYDRIHVQDVNANDISWLDRDDGVMRLVNLTDMDPNSDTEGQVVNAQAKGLFAKSSEDRILVMFEYCFEGTDGVPWPEHSGVELVVYLSDVPELPDHRDPQHYIEVGRVYPPRRGRPGSVGGKRFGVFHKYLHKQNLDFVRGTRVELELIGPHGASVLIDNWDPQIQCDNTVCGDLDGSKSVNSWDFLPILGECGLPAELPSDGSEGNECVDGLLSSDGHADARDIVSLEWFVEWFSDTGPTNLCRFEDSQGLPLSSIEEETADCNDCVYLQTMSLGMSPAFPSTDIDPSQTPLLLLGKSKWEGHSISAKEKLLGEQLYLYNHELLPIEERTLHPGYGIARLISDSHGKIYQINLTTGIHALENGPSNIVLAPGQHYLIDSSQEGRYHEDADVYIGLYGTETEPLGRPVWDAAVTDEYLYVVPVVVVPESNPPYMAAARLDRSETGIKIYDDPDFFDANLPDNPDLGGLCEIEVDSSGNVYVLNAHNRNESDVLWKYGTDGESVRVELGDPSQEVYCPNPVGLCISDGIVYVGSGRVHRPGQNETSVYGFFTDTMSLSRTIVVHNLQQVTDITSGNAGTILVLGLNIDRNDVKNKKQWSDIKSPFYEGRLAQIKPSDIDVNDTIALTDPKDPALPISLLWLAH